MKMEALQTSETRTVEPIVLDRGLLLDGEAIRNPNGSYRIDSQQGWERYLALFGKRLPTVGEYVAAIKQLHEGNNPDLAGILQDLQESALCTGTKIDYDKSNLPLGNGYLNVLVKDPAWKRALEEEIFQYDALKTIDTIQSASGKRSYIWTPDASGRKLHPERAVWLYCITDRFGLSCDYDPIGYNGRARRVRGAGEASREAPTRGIENLSLEMPAVRQRTRDEILMIAKPLVAEPLWNSFVQIVPQEAPVTGDVLQRTADERYMSAYSWEEFKRMMEKLK
ncbi:MAG: hypothetical protein AABW53_00280 [Nanoarchaeota archaeon]